MKIKDLQKLEVGDIFDELKKKDTDSGDTLGHKLAKALKKKNLKIQKKVTIK